MSKSQFMCCLSLGFPICKKLICLIVTNFLVIRSRHLSVEICEDIKPCRRILDKLSFFLKEFR